MTNEEMLLRALMGEELTVTEFHPQTNKQAYLAYAVGLITDPALLPAPRTNEEVLLYQLSLNGSGGVELPELLNPATAAQILAGYEAINQDGSVLTGTNDLEEQNARLEGRLNGDGSVGEDWYITNARGLFAGGVRLDAIEGLVSRMKDVTSMYQMFYSCSSLANLDVSKFDTSNVTAMDSMFYGCSSLTSLDVSKWDTSHLNSMNSMFSGCRSLTTLEGLADWNISNVKSLASVFNECRNLSSLDVSNWDTSNITNMESVFYSCNALKDLDVSNWDTSKVTSMSQMFAHCSALTSLDVSKWDTSNLKNMARMFSGCSSLVSLDFSNWDTSKVTSMDSVFGSCSALEEIIGFSATNKAGLSIYFPWGGASFLYPLKRLTFRTDLPDGVYSIRSAIYIPYCSFRRDGMAEMFNTLPDVSALGLTSAQSTITITGNACLLNTISLSQNSYYDTVASTTWENFLAAAKKRYCGYDFSSAPVEVKNSTVNKTVTVGELDKDAFESYTHYRFLADTITIPEEDKLTDADRAIATSKGWTLVE